MPNHDLESLQARTSRGAFFTPAPKLGATGRNKGGGHRPIQRPRQRNMQAHGGGGITADYLQGTGDADFRDGIQLAAGAP